MLSRQLFSNEGCASCVLLPGGSSFALPIAFPKKLSGFAVFGFFGDMTRVCEEALELPATERYLAYPFFARILVTSTLELHTL